MRCDPFWPWVYCWLGVLLPTPPRCIAPNRPGSSTCAGTSVLAFVQAKLSPPRNASQSPVGLTKRPGAGWITQARAGIREQNNDYFKIRAMVPANVAGRDDVVSARLQIAVPSAASRRSPTTWRSWPGIRQGNGGAKATSWCAQVREVRPRVPVGKKERGVERPALSGP
jgi:hypothetical protein